MKEKTIKFDGITQTYSSLEELWQILNNKNPESLKIGTLNFEFNYTDYSLQTNQERIIVCKPLRMLYNYIDLHFKNPFKNILEFGIYQGGSTLFFAKVFKELSKIVAVDIKPFMPVIDEIISKQDLQNRIKLYYETSQDSPAVLDIIKNEFNAPLDIIMDDCSHRYDLTKKTFEMTFPLLKPGGFYVIEDWGWAHWGGDYQNEDYFGKPALSKLIFELTAVFATNPAWISNINIINGALAVIERGYGEIPAGFNVSESYLYRGDLI